MLARFDKRFILLLVLGIVALSASVYGVYLWTSVWLPIASIFPTPLVLGIAVLCAGVCVSVYLWIKDQRKYLSVAIVTGFLGLVILSLWCLLLLVLFAGG